jgi:UDP-perosamine 4-acetyltransferase
MKKTILIMGPGGQARVVLDGLFAAGKTVGGLLDRTEKGVEVGGSVVLGGPDEWRLHAGDDCEFVVGMANSDMRQSICEEIIAAGASLGSVIHPSAIISPRAKLGQGVIVLAGTVVGPDAVLGDFTLINANCSIDHDCVLETGVQFGPGVTLAGGITCGEHAFLGVGATVLPGIQIGARAVVGAGAVVTKPVAEGTTVVGNPARPLTK